jgi:hypothetical protein
LPEPAFSRGVEHPFRRLVRQYVAARPQAAHRADGRVHLTPIDVSEIGQTKIPPCQRQQLIDQVFNYPVLDRCGWLTADDRLWMQPFMGMLTPEFFKLDAIEQYRPMVKLGESVALPCENYSMGHKTLSRNTGP